MNKKLFKKIFFIFSTIFFMSSLYADEKMTLGLKIYNDKANCGTCHSLEASGSTGNIGPNFDQLKPTFDQIIYAVTNGVGLMQAWEGILTNEEIEAVAYFVFNSTNK